MTHNAKLRVAIAGTGYFSRFHIDGWQRLADAQLVAGWNRDRGRAEAMLEATDATIFDDFETMLDHSKPDILDIATAPAVHLTLIKLAAARGIHVICQKPFCANDAEANEAIALCAKSGTKIVVHENFRFQPWYRLIQRTISDGTLGDLYQITFRLRPGDGQGPEAYLDRQPFFRDMDRLLIHETAVHFIDTFRFLIGPIKSVQAKLRRLNPVIAGEDSGIVLFEFENGVQGIFDGNRLADHKAINRRQTMGEMLIEGSKATLTLNGDGEVFLRHHGEVTEEKLPLTWHDSGFGGDCVHDLQEHVVSHLKDGTPLENEAADYRNVQMVEAAIYRAHEERREIAVANWEPPSG